MIHNTSNIAIVNAVKKIHLYFHTIACIHAFKHASGTAKSIMTEVLVQNGVIIQKRKKKYNAWITIQVGTPGQVPQLLSLLPN